MVYVRQSTPQQVVENRESLARQYALADHAISLGWPTERVLVIDEDLGLSGRTADTRLGFQRLLAEVSMDHVGLVLGLEMSRLSRSCKDWHHLLEVCAIFGALLADQDGIYDPSDPNDRLLLGLKGQISELELHTIRSRLVRGKLNKARRGELFINAPTGYVKTPAGGLALDPDEQVRFVVRLIFDKFDELGTAHAVAAGAAGPLRGRVRDLVRKTQPCGRSVGEKPYPLVCAAVSLGSDHSSSQARPRGRVRQSPDPGPAPWPR